MELGEDGVQKEAPKHSTSDPKQNINTLIQRQAKFLETCREIKVLLTQTLLRLQFGCSERFKDHEHYSKHEDKC